MLSISEKIAAHTSRISELQQKIKDVEHKGTTHHNHFHLIYLFNYYLLFYSNANEPCSSGASNGS